MNLEILKEITTLKGLFTKKLTKKQLSCLVAFFTSEISYCYFVWTFGSKNHSFLDTAISGAVTIVMVTQVCILARFVIEEIFREAYKLQTDDNRVCQIKSYSLSWKTYANNCLVDILFILIIHYAFLWLPLKTTSVFMLATFSYWILNAIVLLIGGYLLRCMIIDTLNIEALNYSFESCCPTETGRKS